MKFYLRRRGSGGFSQDEPTLVGLGRFTWLYNLETYAWFVVDVRAASPDALRRNGSCLEEMTRFEAKKIVGRRWWLLLLLDRLRLFRIARRCFPDNRRGDLHPGTIEGGTLAVDDDSESGDYGREEVSFGFFDDREA